jgi:hypothetical protein
MVAPWRVARSLETLLAQINAAYPNRSKVADGSIGDAAHAASVSDHNPDQYGVVRARDYTHDPAHGFDVHAMADRLIASRDPRIKYVISRGRIASATISPWVWRTYSGTNPHDHHAHVSVVADSRADNPNPWSITAAAPPQEDDMSAADVTEIVTEIKKYIRAVLIDGYEVGGKPYPGIAKVDIETQRRITRTSGEVAAVKAALAALSESLPAEVAKKVTAALDANYDAEITLTPKES